MREVEKYWLGRAMELARRAAARAWARRGGREHDLPDDVQAGFVPLTRHRLHPRADALLDGEALAGQLLDETGIP